MRVFAALALVTLASCATVDFEAADDAACMSPQSPAGSLAYVQCREALAADRAERTRAANARFFAVMQGLSTMGGASAPNQPMHSPAQSPAPVRTTCFARGESVSGFNKICYYDCLGSAYAVTQSSVSLCPITVQR